MHRFCATRWPVRIGDKGHNEDTLWSSTESVPEYHNINNKQISSPAQPTNSKHICVDREKINDVSSKHVEVHKSLTNTSKTSANNKSDSEKSFSSGISSTSNMEVTLQRPTFLDIDSPKVSGKLWEGSSSVRKHTI